MFFLFVIEFAQGQEVLLHLSHKFLELTMTRPNMLFFKPSSRHPMLSDGDAVANRSSAGIRNTKFLAIRRHPSGAGIAVACANTAIATRLTPSTKILVAEVTS